MAVIQVLNVYWKLKKKIHKWFAVKFSSKYCFFLSLLVGLDKNKVVEMLKVATELYIVCEFSNSSLIEIIKSSTTIMHDVN